MRGASTSVYPSTMSTHRLAALLLATTLAACGDRTPHVIQVQPASAEPARPGTMVVSGQATLEVSPDCADLTITIGADDRDPGTAVKAVEAKKRALIAALQATGVAGGQVTLSNLQLDPIYAPNPEGWATLSVRTYRAQITVTATTRDFARIADMMSAAASSGATSMATAFRRSDLPELKKQVRAMALAAAKAKAQQTAEALGIELGRITSVAENQGGSMWSSPYVPQIANTMERQGTDAVLGGALQPLTLDVTLGFELATRT